LVPQYSAQKMWYCPTFVALNHVSVIVPGIASRFTRNAGSEKAWMTSSEVMSMRTGVFTGTWSSLISRAPLMCWIFHIHRLPTTCTVIASLGGV
jgi:hypothetical protein